MRWGGAQDARSQAPDRPPLQAEPSTGKKLSRVLVYVFIHMKLKKYTQFHLTVKMKD